MGRRRWMTGACAALIAAGVFAVFGRGFGFEFLRGWDDGAYVFANAHLAWSWENLLYWWREPVEGLYTPLTMNSLMLDALAWGTASPFGFRLTNVLLHLAAAWLFFSIGRKEKIPACCLCGIVLIWACQVQRLESVVWIAERKDVLGGALTLAAWRCMLDDDRKRGALLAGLCGVLAVFAKPSMAGAAVLIAVVGFLRRDRGEAVWKTVLRTGLPALLTILAMLPAWSIASGDVPPQNGLARTVLVVTHNLIWYCAGAVWPLETSPVYPRVSGLSGLLLLWFAAIAAFTLVCGKNVYGSPGRWFRKYGPWMLVWGAFCAPSCGWRGFSNTDYADRYNYLPALIFWYCMARMARDAAARKRDLLRRETCAVWVLAALSAAWTCVWLPRIWQDTESLFTVALAVHEYPNPRAAEGLGRYGLESSSSYALEAASQAFAKLAETAAKNPLPPELKPAAVWRGMAALYGGLSLYRAKKYAEAADRWRELAAADRLPVYYPELYAPILYGSHADACLRTGRAAEAKKSLTKQLKSLEADCAAAYRAKGLLALLSGDEKEALRCFESGLRRSPGDDWFRTRADFLRARIK